MPQVTPRKPVDQEPFNAPLVRVTDVILIMAIATLGLFALAAFLGVF